MRRTAELALNPADEALALAELRRRHTIKQEKARPSARRAFAFVGTFFRRQSWFARDPAKRKAALTTRRAGKSTALAGILLEAAQNEPWTTCIFIALTRKQAQKIMWKELFRLNEKYSLGLKFNKTTLTATLRNGSEIMVCGATDDRDIDRLRGQPFLVCAIDEAGSFPEDLLEELVKEVLGPATLDYDGQILLTGTPTAACAGLFYRATTGDVDKRGKPTPSYQSHPPKKWETGDDPPADAGKRKGWAVHGWTLHDNPYVPKAGSRFKTAAEWLAWLREEEGIAENDPAYLREYCRMWIKDETSLVYPEINEVSAIARAPAPDDWRAPAGEQRGTGWVGELLEDLPTPPKGTRGRIKQGHAPVIEAYTWRYGLSIDLGYDDPCAIALFAWCPELPEIYCAELEAKSGMVISEIAARVKSIRERVGYFAFCVIDQGGGSGKMVAEEFRSVYKIDCVGAEKTKKETFLRFCNADFRAGRLKIVAPKCPGLFGQLKALQWDPKKPGKEDPRFANDKADAFLYGYRAARQIHWQDKDLEPPAATPDPESVEGKERIHEQLRKGVEKKVAVAKRRSKQWWKPGGGK